MAEEEKTCCIFEQQVSNCAKKVLKGERKSKRKSKVPGKCLSLSRSQSTQTTEQKSLNDIETLFSASFS